MEGADDVAEGKGEGVDKRVVGGEEKEEAETGGEG